MFGQRKVGEERLLVELHFEDEIEQQGDGLVEDNGGV